MSGVEEIAYEEEEDGDVEDVVRTGELSSDGQTNDDARSVSPTSSNTEDEGMEESYHTPLGMNFLFSNM